MKTMQQYELSSKKAVEEIPIGLDPGQGRSERPVPQIQDLRAGAQIPHLCGRPDRARQEQIPAELHPAGHQHPALQ